MHIETLKIFCDLAELASFSKTANKNHLSQSAVSQQLAQLETTYKCQLINRTKRPIELTKEGRLLYKTAKDIYEKHERLRYEISQLKVSSESKISVGAIFSIGMHTLPFYTKEFMKKYPKVNIHIEYLSAERIYDLVLKGEFDLGIVAVAQKDKRFEVYEFIDEELIFACNPKHQLANSSGMDINRIQFEKFIAFESGVPTRLWIDNIFQKYNIIVKPAMEFDNIETIKRAVEINSGVSILPRTAILQEINAGTIRAIEFSNEKFVRPTAIIARKDRLKSQLCQEFLFLLRKNKTNNFESFIKNEN